MKMKCSFCDRDQADCRRLIASPLETPEQRAYICDECVGVCVSILNDDGAMPIDGPPPLPLQVRIARKIAGTYGRIRELPKQSN